MTSNLFSKSLTLTSLVTTLVSVNVQGQSANYDINIVDRPSVGEYCDGFTITPNSGWRYCEFDITNDTDTFTIDTDQAGCFRATDYFSAGDEFTVVNLANNMAGSGGFIAGEPLLPSDPWGDDGWESANYFSARAGLSGSNSPYSIAVTGTVNISIPAGYYVRFDTGKVCNPLKAEDLVSSHALIVTNTGRESEDVFFPNGEVAARSVAPGVTVVMPAK
jgi:hypothetical protein